MLLSYQKKRRMFLGTGLKEFRFVDYARRILSKTSATAAPDLYVMAPSGVSPIIKALASEFNVNVHSYGGVQEIIRSFEGNDHHCLTYSEVFNTWSACPAFGQDFWR